MTLGRIRLMTQLACFGLLTYGGRIGMSLGHFLPCLSCPYVGGCAGDCYLMALQSPFYGLQIALPQLASHAGLTILGLFAGFCVLGILLSKTWCGWVCPFGTLQDMVGALRRRLGIRESRIPWEAMDRLKSVKYILLALLLIIPLLIANAGLHPDLRLPFCQVCPAKPLMPLFEGNARHLALDFSNPVTLAMSVLSVTSAAFFLAGTFFKDRLFCAVCPLLALLSILDKIGLFRLKKSAASCLGCGNCQRACPSDIRELREMKADGPSSRPECVQCFKCAESCPQDEVLTVSFLGLRLFASSKRHARKLMPERRADGNGGER